jgi:uncharacterized protein
VGPGGLEYLFGYAFTDANGHLAYQADWAFSPAHEKAAFERFVDFIILQRAWCNIQICTCTISRHMSRQR